MKIEFDFEERFWAKINKTAGCWLWTGAKNLKGYGRFKVRGRFYSSHRIMFLTHFIIDSEDEIKGFDVCHKCDNPSCVNPNHLFLGTRRDNMADCSSKGRIYKRVSSIVHGPSGYVRNCRCNICVSEYRIYNRDRKRRLRGTLPENFRAGTRTA